jgi:hypothetical protein
MTHRVTDRWTKELPVIESKGSVPLTQNAGPEVVCTTHSTLPELIPNINLVSFASYSKKSRPKIIPHKTSVNFLLIHNWSTRPAHRYLFLELSSALTLFLYETPI